MNKYLIVVLASAILGLSLYNIILSQPKNVNILNDNYITQGVGWKNNQSYYSGSELSFGFNKSHEIAFEFDTNSQADQEIEIYIDKKLYLVSSPNLESQKITIIVDKNKPHVVTVRHVCNHFLHPCHIKLKGIYLKKGATLTHYQAHSKILSILGDSISTIYGKDNYIQALARDLGYELHNASIVGSTISNVKGGDNAAIKRYKKDLLYFKSDVVIIFLGTNDAAKIVPLEVFETDYSKIVSDIKKHNPDGKIFLVSSLPRADINYDISKDYNARIKMLADKYNLNYIDPYYWLDEKDFSDGIHPSFESQKKLAKSFENILSSILK